MLDCIMLVLVPITVYIKMLEKKDLQKIQLYYKLSTELLRMVANCFTPSPHSLPPPKKGKGSIWFYILTNTYDAFSNAKNIKQEIYYTGHHNHCKSTIKIRNKWQINLLAANHNGLIFSVIIKTKIYLTQNLKCVINSVYLLNNI